MALTGSIRELGGNLIVYDSGGNEILTVDMANRAVTFPPGSGLTTPEHIDATDVADEAITLAKLAADTNTWLNTIRTYLADGMLQIGTLLISAVAAEKFKTTTTLIYTIEGLPYTKAATDELVFSENDTINTAADTGFFWGVWLVQIDTEGTVTTKSPAADQVYASEALAIAALPAVDAGNVQVGYIAVQSEEDVDWVANTDDLTPTSDCTDANFYDLPAAKTLPAEL